MVRLRDGVRGRPVRPVPPEYGCLAGGRPRPTAGRGARQGERKEQMRVLESLWRSRQPAAGPRRALPGVEPLEERDLMAANVALVGTTLSVRGGPFNDSIAVLRDAAAGQLVVQDYGREVFRVAETAVTLIRVNGLGGNDRILVGPGVVQNAVLRA